MAGKTVVLPCFVLFVGEYGEWKIRKINTQSF